MTRHSDQLAHIQRKGINAGCKVAADPVDEVDVFCCDACGAWCDTENMILARWPYPEGVVCPKCANMEAPV